MKSVFLCLSALALSACANTPPALLAVADPSQGLRKQATANVAADARQYELVEPLEWAELNRRVAPKGKQP